MELVNICLEAMWVQASQYVRYFQAPSSSRVGADLEVDSVSGDVSSVEGVRCIASEPLGQFVLVDGTDPHSLERAREECLSVMKTLSPADVPREKEKYEQLWDWLAKPENNVFGTHSSCWENRLVVTDLY